MPRTARQDRNSRFLHILNRGNDRATIFHKDGDYAAFLRCFATAKASHPVKAFSFCLMPNHFHLVAETDGPSTLATFIQRWMTSHVRRYHAHHHTSGHLWQGRFKSFPITDDAHFLTVFRYVLQNPVRTGLAARAGNWRWSSLNFPDLIDPLLVPHPGGRWGSSPCTSENGHVGFAYGHFRDAIPCELPRSHSTRGERRGAGGHQTTWQGRRSACTPADTGQGRSQGLGGPARIRRTEG